MNTPIRVMHILDSLNRGGTEALVLDVCRKGREHGLDISMVATGGGDMEDEFASSGVDFVRMQRRFPFDLHLIRELRTEIRRRGIQVVHAHQAVDGMHAYLATVGLGVQRVLSHHGMAYDKKNQLVLRYLIPRMDANIAVSQAFLNTLRHQWYVGNRGSFNVLWNGIDDSRLFSTRKVLRHELSLPANALLCGMVGSFARWKDHMTVCRALPEVMREFPNMEFAFIGSWIGDDRRRYDDCVQVCAEHGLADRVHFVGKRSEIPGVLRSLDLFVLSSLEDTFGIAVVEAMMVGIPTIISDIPPFIEISNKGKYASLFEVGNSKDLAMKMIRLLTNQKERGLLGASAKGWALVEFSITRHLDTLRHLYSSLCAV